VLRVRVRAEVVDADGGAVEVSGRGLLTAGVERLSVDGGPWQPVVGWAGPWPVTERWWSVRRRRARLQVVTADGVARLLCSERGEWWVEALYD
jgi:protein ImuB